MSLRLPRTYDIFCSRCHAPINRCNPVMTQGVRTGLPSSSKISNTHLSASSCSLFSPVSIVTRPEFSFTNMPCPASHAHLRRRAGQPSSRLPTQGGPATMSPDQRFAHGQQLEKEGPPAHISSSSHMPSDPSPWSSWHSSPCHHATRRGEPVPDKVLLRHATQAARRRATTRCGKAPCVSAAAHQVHVAPVVRARCLRTRLLPHLLVFLLGIQRLLGLLLVFREQLAPPLDLRAPAQLRRESGGRALRSGREPTSADPLRFDARGRQAAAGCGLRAFH